MFFTPRNTCPAAPSPHPIKILGLLRSHERRHLFSFSQSQTTRERVISRKWGLGNKVQPLCSLHLEMVPQTFPCQVSFPGISVPLVSVEFQISRTPSSVSNRKLKYIWCHAFVEHIYIYLFISLYKVPSFLLFSFLLTASPFSWIWFCVFFFKINVCD